MESGFRARETLKQESGRDGRGVVSVCVRERERIGGGRDRTSPQSSLSGWRKNVAKNNF